MLDALLFDLDGTLLGLDVPSFLPRYLMSMVATIGSRHPGFPFRDRLLSGAQVMIAARRPKETVAAAFDRVFFEGVDGKEEQRLRADFEAYYETSFKDLKDATRTFPESAAIVREAHRHAGQVVLATNPLFPRAATLARVAWAGIDPGLFDCITTYEDATALKPDPAYYTQLTDALDVRPSRCWMVGNDLLEDGMAKAAGIPFYFVDGTYALRRPGAPDPDRTGSLGEVRGFLRTL